VRIVINDRRIEYAAKRRGVAVAEHEASLTPIGRRLEPEEIVPLAACLASPAAAVILGKKPLAFLGTGPVLTKCPLVASRLSRREKGTSFSDFLGPHQQRQMAVK